jgi:hypothetical protein
MIIGICAILGVLIFVAGLTLLLLCLRKGKRQMRYEQDVGPAEGNEESNPHLSITTFPIVEGLGQVYCPKSADPKLLSPGMPPGSSLNSEQQSESTSVGAISANTSEHTTSPTSSLSPSLWSTYTKIIQAYSPSIHHTNIGIRDADVSLPPLLASSSDPAGHHADPIIQHEDAGRFQEIPPPYVNHSTNHDLHNVDLRF